MKDGDMGRTHDDLQAALEKEKRRSTELRSNLESLQSTMREMKADLKKQLDEARRKIESTEARMTEQSARLSALGMGREETMRALQDAERELRRVRAERDQLQKRMTSIEGMQTETVALGEGDSELTSNNLPSIDELMANLNEIIEENKDERRAGGFDQSEVEAMEPEWQEMLAPELIVPEGYSEDDDKLPGEQWTQRLLVFLDADKPRKFTLFKELMTIGRSESADIQIDGDFISRIHARILCNDKETVIEDAGSKNGVKINSNSVVRHVLRHGDIIGIGKLRFTFVDAASDD